METKKLILTWDEYFKLCDNLVEQSIHIGFTDIVAIARGGFLPAQYIAYKMNVKRIHNFGMSSYSDTDKKLNDEEVKIYQCILTPFTKEQRVLIVDDIADSGRTLETCIRLQANEFGHAKILDIATLHYKSRSLIKPNYFAQKVESNVWVVYPYDKP